MYWLIICVYVWQVSDDDEYPKKICTNCKCQLDILVKFLADLSAGQLFLQNVYKMCKSKQFFSSEHISTTGERVITLKNTNNDVDFVCETCGLTLANRNDLLAHLKIHCGIKINPVRLNV